MSKRMRHEVKIAIEHAEAEQSQPSAITPSYAAVLFAIASQRTGQRRLPMHIEFSVRNGAHVVYGW